MHIQVINFNLDGNLFDSAATAERCYGEPSAEILAAQIKELKYRIDGLHEKLKRQGVKKRKLKHQVDVLREQVKTLQDSVSE